MLKLQPTLKKVAPLLLRKHLLKLEILSRPPFRKFGRTLNLPSPAERGEREGAHYVANEVSVKVETKNTFKYDYFPGFLLCLKNA